MANFKFGLEFDNGYRKNLFLEADDEVDACWKVKAVADENNADVTYIHHARKKNARTNDAV